MVSSVKTKYVLLVVQSVKNVWNVPMMPFVKNVLKEVLSMELRALTVLIIVKPAYLLRLVIHVDLDIFLMKTYV